MARATTRGHAVEIGGLRDGAALHLAAQVAEGREDALLLFRGRDELVAGDDAALEDLNVGGDGGRGGARRQQGPERIAQDRGVAREVGRYRQPAPRLLHHEGERPGRRIRQEEVQGAPRGGQRGRRVERRRARLRRQGAMHPYMQRLGLRTRRGVVELRLPARRPLQRGDRRPLRRTEEGRASSEPSSWITCTGTTTSGSTRRWATCRRSSSGRRGRPSRNRPNKCCQSSHHLREGGRQEKLGLSSVGRGLWGINQAQGASLSTSVAS